ncbi:MAG: glycine cleavage system aminomethyltransferase GcvT [Akkermansiaceae bacterium]|nr:glycine cleavage system aminomethyltransferase GcvT [Akkermansiaceae bacterium]
MSETDKRTPLHDRHVEIGGRMVSFAGWDMPVQYATGIIGEHRIVRTACGVFDISHMGQFEAKGEHAAEWLGSLLTNDALALEVGRGQYTLMLNERGGVIDDMIIYRSAEESFLIVVNASMIDEDFAWMEAHRAEGVSLTDRSDDFAGMAVQGPECSAVFRNAFPGQFLPSRNGIRAAEIDGDGCFFCRTGYTGEDGFEFFCPASSAVKWFDRLIAAGAKPCGLGARDSLRLEMCYPLNGSDLSPDRTPIEAGLGFFCALDTDFIGAEMLRRQKAEGPRLRLAAIEYTQKGAPPRHGYEVQTPDGTRLGELSSGILSPSIGKGIGMAYLPAEYAKPGTPVQVIVRGRPVPAVTVRKPFYRKDG